MQVYAANHSYNLRKSRLPQMKFLLLLLTSLLCGCQTSIQQKHFHNAFVPDIRFDAQSCGQYLRRLDQLIDQAGVNDAQYIKTGLTTRLSRPLSSLPSTQASDSMRRLDQEARQIELHNLESVLKLNNAVDTRWLTRQQQALETCYSLLEPVADMSRVAPALDDYVSWRRVLGLYPITSWFVRRQIDQLHRDLDILTKTKLPEPYLTYVPDDSAAAPNAAVVDVLTSLTDVTSSQLSQWLRQYRPVWQVQHQSRADYIGQPYWRLTQQNTNASWFDAPQIDIEHPVSFEYISYTWFEDQLLPQMNYVIWFSARPKTHWLDLVGGHLDGLTWRVTLNRQGQPLLFDSMHNCGCYHVFFTTPSVRLRVNLPDREPPLVLHTVPDIQTNERYQLSVTAGDHYHIRMSLMDKAPAPGRIAYTSQSYNNLRRLPVYQQGQRSGMTRSLFDARGIVPGTQRLERFVLWPMGVPDPGEMRQQGRHPTAFIGRRYFDQPDLMDHLFTRRGTDEDDI